MPLTVEQSRAFLAVAHRHRLGALFSVALASGLRLGEATGLRWDDVNLETGEVRVRQQLQRVGKQLVLQPLKTEKSRRTLMLPAVCLEHLRQAPTASAEGTAEGRRRLVRYRPRLHHVSRAADQGSASARRSIRGTSCACCTCCWSARSFRVVGSTTCDTARPVCLIAAGVELVEVSMLLGHSELRVTADLYTHLQKQTAATAARHMDAVLRG